MIPDGELAQRWLAGDRTALAELFCRYERALFGYLLRMLGHSHDAEEALQDTFVSAINGRGSYEERGKFRAWLFRIAHNEALRVIRSRTRHPQGPHGMDGLRDDAPDPEEDLMRAEACRRVEQAIASLPDAEREVVLLRHYSGMLFREIADVLEAPLGTVLSRHHTAARRLSRRLSDLKEE